MSGCRVYLYVDPWEGITVLGACFVKVAEVHADPPLSASFLDHYYVRQLVRVVNLPDEALFLLFADLFCYGSVSLWGEHSLLLSDWRKGR